MASSESTTHLHWLPPTLPANMSLLVSLRDETNISWHRIKAKQAAYLMLDQLPQPSRRAMVQEFFERYNKVCNLYVLTVFT